MINLKSIVANLQVPECKKENHFNEKLSMICLDKNCPDFLKSLCSQCQTEHKHILYSVKGVINQIIQVISQPTQNQNINQSNASERFDSVLKSINQLISLSQQLLKYVNDQKTQLIGEPSNKTEIAQLLNDISNQDASTIHEKMKKVFSYLNLSLQNQIVITLKQAQEIKQETKDYLDFVQKLVLQAQSIISDTLKQNWKTGSNYLNLEQQLKKCQDQNYQKEQFINQQKQDLYQKQQKIQQYDEQVDQLSKQIKDLQIQNQQIQQQQQQIQQQNMQMKAQEKKYYSNKPYQFVWNNDCENKMKEDLKDLKPDKYPKECEKSYKKWKQLYSTLMQKSGGKQGFCGKNPVYGWYYSETDEWHSNLNSHTCGKSDGCAYGFYCCKECWDKGEGGAKNEY